MCAELQNQSNTNIIHISFALSFSQLNHRYGYFLRDHVLFLFLNVALHIGKTNVQLDHFSMWATNVKFEIDETNWRKILFFNKVAEKFLLEERLNYCLQMKIRIEEKQNIEKISTKKLRIKSKHVQTQNIHLI